MEDYAIDLLKEELYLQESMKDALENENIKSEKMAKTIETNLILCNERIASLSNALKKLGSE